MTEAHAPPARPRASRSLARPRGRALWWLALLAALTIAILAGPALGGGALQLANPDLTAVSAVRAAFDALPDDALVLVAMDGDLGTYPEVRPAVRTALDDLLRRGAGLAFVSVSVDGRAIGAAELARLRAGGADPERLLDLGFVSGVEAGLVRLVADALPPGAEGAVASAIEERGGGLAAFDLFLLVGGTDVGPRTWVEQVGTRLPQAPMVGMAPTFAQPELAPYLRTGQLAALLATVRDDAAYVQSVGAQADEPAAVGSPSAAAMLLGMLVALVVLVQVLASALPRLRGPAPRPAFEDDEA
ncbi:MAG TPA: hypothetical protein VFY43_03010 [Candidatus Limnocylindria bacterium]|nr:hypothetical protein [Candidatus Limnocylindria bacterium]